MPKTDPQLEREVATALVSAFLAASPRVDTFSTWLMGITTGFLVLLFTNIERAVSVIKIGPARALIVVLAVSIVMGLLQKWMGLRLLVQVDMDEASDRKLLEVVKAHSGQTVADPNQYYRKHADVSNVLTLVVSAFPKWTHRFLYKIVQSVDTSDLSHLKKETNRFIWQFAALTLQLICALGTIVIVLFSL